MNFSLLNPERLTVAEFRAMEMNAPAEERWELISGRVHIGEAGDTVRHNDIVQNVAFTLRSELRRIGSSCRTSTQNVRLDIDAVASSVLPDVVVNVGERRGSSKTFRTAVAIVEVISPSTSLQDRIDKLSAYLTLTDLKSVAIVEQSKMHVTVHSWTLHGWVRNDFALAGDIVVFEGTSVSMTLAQIYDEIDFAA